MKKEEQKEPSENSDSITKESNQEKSPKEEMEEDLKKKRWDK